MAERTVEDDNGRTEDTRSKPAHVCSCCRESDKSLRKSVRNKRLAKSVGMGEELFPGVLNDITLKLIIPKLSWRVFQVLRSVSPTWQQAIQSHVVYDSRVRSQSTETLAIVAHRKPSVKLSLELSLYSLRDDIWSSPPPNPYFPEGIPSDSQCVSLDGKLYIMGGIKEYRREFGHTIRVGSAKVYVLDIAGLRQWQECADMREPRLEFGCGVMDGKIYVFGGTSHDKPLSGSEVYDPKVNTWSWIKPMMHSRVKHYVFKLGQELFVHGGYDSTTVQRWAVDGSLHWTTLALSLEAYDPVKDKWRMITRSFGQSHTDNKLFTAQGKIYLMTLFPRSDRKDYIDLYDIEKQTWTRVQSCCPGEDLEWYMPPSYNIVVDHELLGISFLELKSTGRLGHWLLRGRGFGNEKQDVVWELCASPRPDVGHPISMWPIQI